MIEFHSLSFPSSIFGTCSTAWHRTHFDQAHSLLHPCFVSGCEHVGLARNTGVRNLLRPRCGAPPTAFSDRHVLPVVEVAEVVGSSPVAPLPPAEPVLAAEEPKPSSAAPPVAEPNVELCEAGAAPLWPRSWSVLACTTHRTSAAHNVATEGGISKFCPFPSTRETKSSGDGFRNGPFTFQISLLRKSYDAGTYHPCPHSHKLTATWPEGRLLMFCTTDK